MHHTSGQQPDPPPNSSRDLSTSELVRNVAVGSWPRILTALRRAGEQAGSSAADWWAQDTVGGHTTGDVTATARRVLAGIDDGDPAVLDALPACDLSDQCPDDPTGADVYAQAAPCGAPAWDALGEQARTQVADAYRDGYDTAAQDRVARHCRNALPPPGTGEHTARRRPAG